MPAKFDQHFLTSESVADRIVAAAGISPGESVVSGSRAEPEGTTADKEVRPAVVEIGPGRGILTARLIQTGARLTVVEIDERLHAEIEARFRGRLTAIRADFLKLDLSLLPSPAVVVSNLPYSVGTMILNRLLDWKAMSRAVLMFQKEVAQRILAEPGSKDYGLLSLAVRVKADAEDVCEVPKECFSPRPRVDSAVVRLTPAPRPRLPEGVSQERFFTLARAAFSQRRKMAAKNVAGALGLPRASVERAFQEAGVDVSARAETIGLEAFARLARSLTSSCA